MHTQTQKHTGYQNIFTWSAVLAFFQVLKELTMKCLELASGSHYTSIAFPAFGTGKLAYPPAEVAVIMSEAIDLFQKASPASSVRNATFVVFNNAPVFQVLLR